MEIGDWGMENGECGMGDGDPREMGNGEWVTVGKRQWEMGIGAWGMEDGEWGVGSSECGVGNG